MAHIIAVRNIKPTIEEGVFLAETATVIGDVTIGKDSSVWFGAVLRGDVNFIKIGERTNIQDNVTLHGSFNQFSTTLEDDVTIGHNAVIHGACIKRGSLVGMGATVLDGAVVGEESIVAAGSVVTGNSILEPRSLYAGIPAKKIKDLEEGALLKLRESPLNYLQYKSWYN